MDGRLIKSSAVWWPKSLFSKSKMVLYISFIRFCRSDDQTNASSFSFFLFALRVARDVERAGGADFGVLGVDRLGLVRGVVGGLALLAGVLRLFFLVGVFFTGVVGWVSGVDSVAATSD